MLLFATVALFFQQKSQLRFHKSLVPLEISREFDTLLNSSILFHR